MLSIAAMYVPCQDTANAQAAIVYTETRPQAYIHGSQLTTGTMAAFEILAQVAFALFDQIAD